MYIFYLLLVQYKWCVVLSIVVEHQFHCVQGIFKYSGTSVMGTTGTQLSVLYREVSLILCVVGIGDSILSREVSFIQEYPQERIMSEKRKV